MARLPALIDALALVDGRPRGSIDHVAREVREAGLIQTTKRGRGAAEMTARDAAYLILGLYGSDQPAAAAEAARLYGESALFRTSPSDDHALLAPLAAAGTVAGALAAAIELGPRLAASTPRTQASLRPYMETDDRDGWPDGFSVLLTLTRPHVGGFLTVVWPRRTRLGRLTFGFHNTQGRKGLKPVVPFEVTTRVHTDVLRAVHGALFPPASAE